MPATARKVTKSATPAPKDLELPLLQTKRIVVPIIGVSPLIVHAWSEKARRQMRDKAEMRAKEKRGARDPKAEFESSKYIDEKGHDCIPVFALRKAIVAAATFAENVTKTRIRGALFIVSGGRGKNGEDLIPIQYKHCRMREDAVRIGGMSKTADLRYRAEYTDWRCNVTIEYNEKAISLEQILNLLRLAGFSVGLCEWRPEKDGHFGRFTIGEHVVTLIKGGKSDGGRQGPNKPSRKGAAA